MPLYRTADNRSEAKTQLRKTTKAMSCRRNTMRNLKKQNSTILAGINYKKRPG